MTTVAVVYFSGAGSTRRIAEAVAAGVEKSTADCQIHEIVGADIAEGRWSNESILQALDACDAIVFGSPTYMGGVSAQLKAFFDALVPRWYSEAWSGKVGAAFTVSAKASGDKLNCLQDINTVAMQMGMIWVGTGTGSGMGTAGDLGPNGFYLGLGATAFEPNAVQEIDVQAAEHLGQRVAAIAAKLS